MGLGDCLKTSDVSHANKVRSNGVQLPFLIRLTTTGLQRQKQQQLVKISPCLLALTPSQASQLYHHIVSSIALSESPGSPACLFLPPCQHAHCHPINTLIDLEVPDCVFRHSTDFICTGLLRQLPLICSSLTNLPS